MRFTCKRYTINSLFKPGLSEEQLDKLIDVLEGKKYITIKEQKVSYALPK